MKLSKALKVKNSLVKEITNLKAQITKHNMVIDENKPQFHVEVLFPKLIEKSEKLASLKKNISIANGAIIEQIFKIAEYRGIISMLQELNTQKGIISSEGFRGETKHEYKPQMDDVAVAKWTEELEKKIDEMQDMIDEYNATHEVN